MGEMTVQERVFLCVRANFEFDNEIMFTAEARLDELGLDSLAINEMLMTLEHDLEIQVYDEESNKLQTIGDLIRLVEAKLDASVS